MSIVSSSLFGALLVSAPFVSAQVHVRTNDRPSANALQASPLEAAIYLELYGHPDTARRQIEVRVHRDRVELTGAAAGDFERRIAQQLTLGVVPDLRVEDRIEIRNDRPHPRTPLSGSESPAELERRFTDLLSNKFPAEILRELTLTVYLVELQDAGTPASKSRGRDAEGCVLVLEGVVPSVGDQLAMSEVLLFESPAAAAVINHTHVSDGYAPGHEPKTHVRVPLVHVDVGSNDGVEVHVGPLVVRTGGGYRAADDPDLLDNFMSDVRSDDDLDNVALQAHVRDGVLTIEGSLRAADKMRAISLASHVKGARGIVDRIEVVEGGRSYYSDDDVENYLRYRLGEHACARDVDIDSGAKHRLRLRAVAPTDFHARLAQVVIAGDPALTQLTLESEFRDAASGTVVTLRR
jgi:osmotically-inducible protein OsmY